VLYGKWWPLPLMMMVMMVIWKRLRMDSNRLFLVSSWSGNSCQNWEISFCILLKSLLGIKHTLHSLYLPLCI
jgi:hypothetical protein